MIQKDIFNYLPFLYLPTVHGILLQTETLIDNHLPSLWARTNSKVPIQHVVKYFQDAVR